MQATQIELLILKTNAGLPYLQYEFMVMSELLKQGHHEAEAKVCSKRGICSCWD